MSELAKIRQGLQELPLETLGGAIQVAWLLEEQGSAALLAIALPGPDGLLDISQEGLERAGGPCLEILKEEFRERCAQEARKTAPEDLADWDEDELKASLANGTTIAALFDPDTRDLNELFILYMHWGCMSVLESQLMELELEAGEL